MNNERYYITVWHDKTHTCQYLPNWIVSLNDKYGSETLAVNNSRERAEETARAFARTLKVLIKYN